jgi:hypothetical protein
VGQVLGGEVNDVAVSGSLDNCRVAVRLNGSFSIIAN